MNTIRPCGCKGVRTCLQCELDYKIEKTSLQQELQLLDALTYCPTCKCLFPGWDAWKVVAEHDNHDLAKGIPFTGVLVQENFLNAKEGTSLMQRLDTLPWDVSQSGRRKQNYGPKANFKKKKLQNGTFAGFPKFTKFIQERFATVDLLKNFQTIEQCSLEYEASKGASIDPHVDDCWIWGERVVTVNCLGDTVLTLTTYVPASNLKYNLNLVPQYTNKLLQPLLNSEELNKFQKHVIRIPMPNLSLIVLYGPARYQFEHSVLREDVQDRRVCIAYREFTPMYMEGGESQEKGVIVNENAQLFWDNYTSDNK